MVHHAHIPRVKVFTFEADVTAAYNYTTHSENNAFLPRSSDTSGNTDRAGNRRILTMCKCYLA